MTDFNIKWTDGGREPQCPANPVYPNGKDIDTSHDAWPSCRTELPYPAKRCGHFLVRCRTCGLKVALTTAGRPDDPRSLTVNCLQTVQ